MLHHRAIAAAAIAALMTTIDGARAFDDARYPDFKGQWIRTAGGEPVRFDGGKPARKQEAPLTAEYQAIFEANVAEQALAAFMHHLAASYLARGRS